MRFQSDATAQKLIKPFSNQDWERIQRPPIQNYIPPNVLGYLAQLIDDPKWMNKTAKKKKEVRRVLKQIGLPQIAAGTNRMCFGCDYDPGIVFKFGLDRVGRSDNIAESYNQYFLNGFGTKILHVLPNGLFSMCERVQTMDQKTFASYADTIYRLITYWAVHKNILIEDIGYNFFKNWGVRIGFGPVLLDYPYIYKIDPFKLVCKRKDPYTQQECMGHIDYDRGLNQIICDRCGVRYGISDIAESNVGEMIKTTVNMKGRVLSMSLVNTSIKVGIKKNGKIVNRFYAETESKIDKSKIIGGKIITSKSIDDLPKEMKEGAKKLSESLAKKNTTDSNNTSPSTNEHYHFYPRGVKNDIIYFLKRIERVHGAETALDLARRLQIKYMLMNYEQEEPESKNNVVVKEVDKTKIQNPEEPMKIMTAEKGPETDLTKECVTIHSKKEEVSDDGTKEDTQNRPKENLFIAKALTAEEIEAINQAKSKETAIMGFPGEPLVDTMKFKELMPRIRELVEKKFNNFKTETKDIEEICDGLSTQIKDYIYEDIKSLMQGDVEALKVNVVKTVDTRNIDCYSVKADNRGTELFDIILYPMSEEEEVTDREYQYDNLLNDKDKLDEFFANEAKNIDISQYENVDEAKRDMIAKLYASLLDTRDRNINYGIQHNKAKELAEKYVEEHFDFKTEETTVEDEL